MAVRLGSSPCPTFITTIIVSRYSRLLLLVLLLRLLSGVDSVVECNATHNRCEELLWKGSECRNGLCSNPFEKGCLHAMLTTMKGSDNERKRQLHLHGDSASHKANRVQALLQQLESQVRACNSDDPPDAASMGICLDYEALVETPGGGSSWYDLYTQYREIRILSQNWESSFFSSWILQIILSEILHVPTTIEGGATAPYNSFYDPLARLGYDPNAMDYEALRTAAYAEYSDCRTMSKYHNSNDDDDDSTYRSCANMIPEVWYLNSQNITEYLDQHIVEPPEGLGAIGQQAIFVTKFTAEEDPTILNLHGLKGEKNRQKLANLFKRPTTWRDYCEIVSETNCTVPDDVAQRPPNSDDGEDDRMHVPGLYKGHFRATEKNNCTNNPTTCTGHIADFPCGWTSFVKPQMYHENIALESDGPEAGSRGYSYAQLSEMWAAANATQSNLMTMWWIPEAIHTTYIGSPSEMQRISLAWPSKECTEHRISRSQRCEFSDPMEQYGDPLGSCDEAPQLLHKVIVGNLHAATYESGIPEAQQSPAYEAMKLFHISELEYGEILQTWIQRGVDKHGFDPRWATCQWVWDNFEDILQVIPRTYPRVAVDKYFYSDPLAIIAITVGSVAALLTVGAAVFTFIHRNWQAIQYAQVEFLALVLLGMFLGSMGAILGALQPSKFTCNTSDWLLVLGYTVHLVPIFVKVYATHKLIRAAERFRRIEIPKSQLFRTVAGITGLVLLYCMIRVLVDPETRKYEFRLSEETNENGETLVYMDPYCGSEHAVWTYISTSWFCFLLVVATILAFRTRNVREEFNESKLLGAMVYAHFLFLVITVTSFVFTTEMPDCDMALIRSLLYGLDTIGVLCIYFLPKFTSKAGPLRSQSSATQASMFCPNERVSRHHPERRLSEDEHACSNGNWSHQSSNNVNGSVHFSTNEIGSKKFTNQEASKLFTNQDGSAHFSTENGSNLCSNEESSDDKGALD